MSRNCICLFALLIIPFLLKGQNIISDSVSLDLYSDKIAISLQQVPEKTVPRPQNGRFVSNISNPSLTAYPAKGKGEKAVVICPGGGYRGLAIDKEGFRVARIFQEKGIHAFVLKYRCPNYEANKNTYQVPFLDAQRAIEMADSLLVSWGYVNVPIGLMGFSAGGHIAAMVSNLPAQPRKPDFTILIYPVVTMQSPFTHLGSKTNLLGPTPEKNEVDKFSAHLGVTESTPPAFIVHASDDRSVPVKNSLLYYEACINKHIPVEMHLYQRGGHGYGLDNKTTSDKWMNRLLNYLENMQP